jgi:hypothetical protein
MEEIDKLSDAAAVKALVGVVREWSNKRGLEALVVVYQVQQRASAALDKSPKWASTQPEASPESGKFARKMLHALATGNDDEVAVWTRHAVKSQSVAAAHVDPITLSILGGIVIGAILAARVKKIGTVEFYEGVPKELADVIKVGSSIATP